MATREGRLRCSPLSGSNTALVWPRLFLRVQSRQYLSMVMSLVDSENRLIPIRIEVHHVRQNASGTMSTTRIGIKQRAMACAWISLLLRSGCCPTSRDFSAPADGHGVVFLASA